MGEKPKKRPRGNPNLKPNVHGLNTAKRVVKELNTKPLDRRTAAGRQAAAFKDGIVADLGGEASVTEAQLQVIEMACKTRFLLDYVDSFLMELGPRMINKRTRSAYPIVQQRNTLADTLLRQLTTLGLERRAAKVPSLQAYIEGKGQ